jgi:N-acetylglucosamine malate deacetylase 1
VPEINKSTDILAFSPHPDDAELGCGGGILLAVKKGFNVVIADLTDGESASRGTPAQRKAEKHRASRILGISNRLSLKFPDTKIGIDPSHLTLVIDTIRLLRPRIVLAPYWIDRHPDHENAGKLVRSACFFSGVASMGKGRPYRPDSLFYYMIHSPFEPSFVLDISTVWEQKCRALKAYRSQLFNKDPGMPPTAISNPAFLHHYEARSVYFGAMVGAAHGEPFFSEGPLTAKEFPGIDNINSDTGGTPKYKSI